MLGHLVTPFTVYSRLSRSTPIPLPEGCAPAESGIHLSLPVKAMLLRSGGHFAASRFRRDSPFATIWRAGELLLQVDINYSVPFTSS